MQRQAIAALSTVLVALALAACGDDGEETTVSTPATEQAQGPQALEQAQGRAEEMEEERRTKEGSEGRKPTEDEPSQAPGPAPAPVEHQDSGGGAAQFQRKGSDNSIQEYGQEGGGSEFAGAATTLHAYLDARAAGRWEDACSYLAAEVVASLERFAAANSGETELEGCPRILQTLSSGAGTAGLRAMANADIGSLRVQGDRGFLLYHGPQGVDFAIPVTVQSGEWKLSAPEGTPLP